MLQETYCKELHKRDYSVYDSKDKEQLDMEELHKYSYMVFDDEELFLLYADYEHELEKETHEDMENAKNELLDMADVFVWKKREASHLLDFWETDGED